MQDVKSTLTGRSVRMLVWTCDHGRIESAAVSYTFCRNWRLLRGCTIQLGVFSSDQSLLETFPIPTSRHLLLLYVHRIKTDVTLHGKLQLSEHLIRREKTRGIEGMGGRDRGILFRTGLRLQAGR